LKIVAKDCSILEPQPNKKQAAWLEKLAQKSIASKLVIPLSPKQSEEEPIVYRDHSGKWWAGRYVGSVSFEGHTLTVQPRFGLDSIREWLREVTSIRVIESNGATHNDNSFITQLIATVWSSGLALAARHGLPALKQDARETGTTIRGKLDVNSSLRHIASRNGKVVSIRTERSLDNAAAHAMVAAYFKLKRELKLPDNQWLSRRARTLVQHLVAATGGRPRLPTKLELNRVRYTPITAGFSPFAELSRTIASGKGFTTDAELQGMTTGVLLDVAELWELYVLSVFKKAAVPLLVHHGTLDSSARTKLIRSCVSNSTIGTLIPDAVVRSGVDVVGVLDAKYKTLHPTVRAPSGPQRNDLYQLVAYLSGFNSRSPNKIWGILAYPRDPNPERPEIPEAEKNSPWIFDEGKLVLFTTLPHNSDEAILKLKGLLVNLGTNENLFKSRVRNYN